MKTASPKIRTIDFGAAQRPSRSERERFGGGVGAEPTGYFVRTRTPETLKSPSGGMDVAFYACGRGGTRTPDLTVSETRPEIGTF